MDFRASGLSGREWCEQNGLNRRQLRYWSEKCKVADAEASGPTWVAVALPPANEPPLTIRVGAVEITVEPGFSPAFLQSVVRTLATG